MSNHMHERNKWTTEKKKKKEIDGIRKIVIDIKKGETHEIPRRYLIITATSRRF